jgi:hypothetical protein
MAEMNDEQSRAYIEQLVKLNPELAKFFTLTTRLNKTIAQRIAAEANDDKSKIAQKKAVEEFTKQIKFSGGDGILGKFSKGLKSGFQDISKFQASLDALDEAIENTTDSSHKLVLEKQRETAAAKLATVAYKGAAADMAMAVGKNAVGAITNGAGKFVKDLQNNASATEISSNLMTSAVDLAAGSAGGLGKGISAAGDAAATLGKPGGKMQMLGVAAGLAGGALSAMASGAGALAKFGIEVLSKEVEKTVKSYNEMNSAGALFANGMTGMRNAANSAGLTVEQFSGVVAKHSTDIASLGMSVGEGTKRIGGALNAGGNTMKNQLLKLGYSFEDQAGLVAETMANMRGSGGPLRASNAQVAEQTQKYAENLRLISAITGEDAKKKAEQAREQNQVLAFQQKMAGKSEAQRAQIDLAMASMTAAERKNFQDRVVLGQVINKEGAIYEATIAGAREKGEAALALFNNNNLTAETNATLNQQYGDQIKASALAQGDLAVAAYAAGGVLTGVATAGLEAVNQAQRYTAEGVAAAAAALAAQKNTTDKLTEGVTGAAIAAQELKRQLEEVLTPAIAQFATVSKKMLEAVTEQLAKLGLSGGTSAEPGFFEKYGDKLKAAGAGAMMGAGTGAQIGGLTGTMTMPVIGTVAGGTVGAVVGGVAGAVAGWFSEKEGKARGGIAEGPMSGYIEKLHGTEAVVPLSEGRSIPVKISYPESAKEPIPVGAAGGGNDLSGMMQQQIDLLRELIGKSADQLDVFSTTRDIQQRLLNNSY